MSKRVWRKGGVCKSCHQILLNKKKFAIKLKTFFCDEFFGVIVYFSLPPQIFSAFSCHLMLKNVSDNYLKQFQQQHFKMLIRQFEIITQHLMGTDTHNK